MSAAMIVVITSVLAGRHAESTLWNVCGWVALATVAALAYRSLGVREAYLGAISVVLTVLIWLRHPQPGAALAAALDQAAFMMAFILLLGLLFETAVTSPSIRECGRYITGQPPGRRFNALYLGTGFLSVLFNLGVISLLVPLIQGGVRAANPDDALNPVRERRQLVAIQRGFAWGIIWSPTALAPLMIYDLIPGIDRGRWILIGLAIATLAMLAGWIEDYLRYRALSRARTTPRPPPPILPRRAVSRFAAAFGWLLLLSATIGWIADDSIVYGLMVACPLMTVGWLWVQLAGSGDQNRVPGELSRILLDQLPLSAPIAVTLACSGFIGRAAAELVPVDALLDQSRLGAIPDYLLLYALPVAIVALSFLALSPIVTAVFLGSVLGSATTLPVDPTLLAIAISCGWALAMTISPFVTIVLLMVRTSGYSAIDLSIRWNTAFALVAGLMLLPVFYLLTGGG